MNKSNIRFSVEYYARQFPEKTGAELLEIFNEQEEKFNLQKSLRNSGKLKIIESLKNFGGYYRSNKIENNTTYQFYFNITNARLSDEVIICNVEIISFVFVDCVVQIQKSFESDIDIDRLHLNECERLGKVNYDVVIEQLNEYIEKSKKLTVTNFSK